MLNRWLAAAALGLVLTARPAAAQNTPEQVVSAYLGHLSRGEGRQAGALMHPRALTSLRSFVAKTAGITGADDAFGAGLDDVPGDSIFAVMVSQFQQEGMAEMMASLRAETVGQLVRGDLAYVVYTARSTVMGTPLLQNGLVVLRRDGANWRVDPGDGVNTLMGAGGPLQILMAGVMQMGMAEAMGGEGKQ